MGVEWPPTGFDLFDSFVESAEFVFAEDPEYEAVLLVLMVHVFYGRLFLQRRLN